MSKRSRKLASGDIATLVGSIEYRAWKHFGFGMSYNYTSYDIDTDDIDFLGNFGYQVDGFEFYGRIAF